MSRSKRNDLVAMNCEERIRHRDYAAARLADEYVIGTLNTKAILHIGGYQLYPRLPGPQCL